MTHRPSKIKLTSHINEHQSSNQYNYVIIGDSVASALYAKRLLNNGVTGTITILTEGVNETNSKNIFDLDYINTNINKILRNLITEKVHYINCGDNHYEDDDEDAVNQADKVVHYEHGASILGNFIASPYIPHIGPWFSEITHSNLDKLVHNNSITYNLNSEEAKVVNTLTTAFDIDQVKGTLKVKRPSISTMNRKFVSMENGDIMRELFIETYDSINSKVNIVSEVDNIKITTGSTGLHNITYNTRGKSTPNTLNNIKLIWKSNPYVYTRLATTSGYKSNVRIQMPVVYRAVVAIPKNNSITGVNLTNINTNEITTTNITLSLDDSITKNSSTLSWLVHIYTSDEDLSTTTLDGTYVSETNKTLLIIDAICLKNKRSLTFNPARNSHIINYNNINVENTWLKKFAEIVKIINKAYTGSELNIDELLSEKDVCLDSKCVNVNTISDISVREMPITAVMDTFTHMYNNDYYPVFSK